jgi:hypothetical protein
MLALSRGDFRARTHCDSDGRLHQRWRVVDAVAHHGRFSPARDKLFDDFVLMVRQGFSMNLIDADLFPEDFSNRRCITSHKYSLQAHVVKRTDCSRNRCKHRWLWVEISSEWRRLNAATIGNQAGRKIVVSQIRQLSQIEP